MASRRFEFIDQWHVPAPPEFVRDLVTDLERYPEWWREIRAVLKLDDDNAVVLCRSVLPYTLELTLTAVSRALPTVRVEIGGDLVGWATWTLEPEPQGGTRMTFAQEVTFERGPAWAVAAARPMLAWNHHRMMESARRGLFLRSGGPAG